MVIVFHTSDGLKQSTLSRDVSTWLGRINTDLHCAYTQKAKENTEFHLHIACIKLQCFVLKAPFSVLFLSWRSCAFSTVVQLEQRGPYSISSLRSSPKIEEGAQLARPWTPLALAISQPPSQEPFISQPPSPDSSLLCIPDNTLSTPCMAWASLSRTWDHS